MNTFKSLMRIVAALSLAGLISACAQTPSANTGRGAMQGGTVPAEARCC